MLLIFFIKTCISNQTRLVKTHLDKHFKVSSSPHGWLFLSVHILHKACISDQTRLVKTPLELNVHYTPNNVPLNAPTLYYTIVGSLVYLIITWLDVSYIVHIVSQFVSSSIIDH